ncbi:MAG TPA: peptidoglycan binding domain-containing protein, partial [Thermomicrobiales bacterium]|nr:peptidoglycan binding domain-containing protein [Thermomicrobiales bacterium]
AVYASQYNGRAYAGVSVAGIDVGGLTESEMRQTLGAAFGDFGKRPLTLTASDESFSVTMADAGIAYDLDATVAQAMQEGREGSWWDRSIAIASSRIHGESLEPVMTLDAATFQSSLVALSPEIIAGPQDAYVDMQASEGPVVVNEVLGTAIDAAGTYDAILDHVETLSTSEIPIALVPIPAAVTADDIAGGVPSAQRAVGAPLSVSTEEGAWELSVEQLRGIVTVDTAGQMQVDSGKVQQFVANIAGEIDRPAQNAQITVDDAGRFVVVPGVDAATVDQQASMEAITSALNSGTPDVSLVVERHQPKIVDAQAQDYANQADVMVGDGITLTWKGDPISLGRGDLIAALVIKPTPGEDAPFALSFDPDVLAERLQPVADQIDVAAQDVQFRLVDGDIRLQSEARQGRELDPDASLDSIMAALGDGKFEAPLTVATVAPRYTSDDRASISLDDLLGDSSTYYGDSSEARRHNVERAVELEDGWLIPPGGIFSYAEFMGLVTKDNGFITGFGIVADEGGGVTTAPVIGGGICQVSTTIFQAAWWSGLPIVERWAHPYWLNGYGQPPRGMKGLDAMVNIEPDWSLDLKFKNTTGNWIALVMIADGENVRAEIYGKNPGWTINVSDPKITNVVKPGEKMIYTDSPELPKGQELQVEHAQEGFDAAITRVVTDKDGKEIDRYVLESTYAASRNTTLRGTGPAE